MKDISFRDDILPLSGSLYRLALRLQLAHEEAQDVVQETMLRLWQRRQQWNEMDNVEAFALTVCRNLALDVLRRRSHRLEAPPEALANMPDNNHHASPERVAESRDRIDTVRQLMAQLPEKQRTAMTLRDLEGKSYREIADIMQVTEEQVKVSIFRARQTVKALMAHIDGGRI